MIQKFFFKIKHWQLFLLVYVAPIILMVFSPQQQKEFINLDEFKGVPEFSTFYIVLIGVSILLSMIIVAWYWSISTGLQYKISEEFRMKTIWFKVAIVIYLLLSLSALVMAYFVIQDFFELFQMAVDNNLQDLGLFFNEMRYALLMIPIMLIIFLCQIYIIFFTAKTYHTALKGEPETFSKYVEEFVMLFFPFVGMWIIQPKLNEWAKEGLENA